MSTATAAELELLVLGMDGDDVVGTDNPDLSAEEEPGDDELKELADPAEPADDVEAAAE